MSESTYETRVDYYWAPAVATPSAPTTSEMTAAQKLTCEMADYPNLSEKTNTVDRPSLCSRFTAKLPGSVTVDDATIKFYYDDTPESASQTIRALLPRDTSGFLIRVDSIDGTLPAVTTSGTKVDVWPATVTSNAKDSPANGELKKFTVGLCITSPPSLDVAVAENAG